MLTIQSDEQGWRALFVMARYGGLRIPSEIINLRWIDFEAEKYKFRVHAPKSERCHHGGIRWTPKFPEVMKHLRALKAERGDADGFVFSEAFRLGKNPRTMMERIIKRAGLTPASM